MPQVKPGALYIKISKHFQRPNAQNKLKFQRALTHKIKILKHFNAQN